MPGRIVSADIAADWNRHEGDLTEGDLAHTVVVQANQIAAAVALHKMWHHPRRGEVCGRCLEAYPCTTAGALGVTA